MCYRARAFLFGTILEDYSMKWVRSLYDWVIAWAKTPYGAIALFLLAFAEASFFPIPPDVLLIALCVGHRERSFWFATICVTGSVLGGAAGYLIGWGLWSGVDQYFFTYVPGFTEDVFQNVQSYYEKYNFWIVFVAAFTPIPYKVITIAAGVFGINFFMFMIASIIGRAGRMFLVAALLYHYGEPIQKFIDKYFNILSIIVVAGIIGGFVVIKYAGH
jgi:membrane protein YqaA with SNARE-associated domain